MDRNTEKSLGWAAVVALIWWVADLVVVRQTQLATGHVVVPFLTLATGLSAFVWARARLRRRADEEKRDLEQLRRERTDRSLFASEEEKFDPFTIGRTHEQFERWLVPAVTLGVAVGLGAWTWNLLDQLRVAAVPPARPLIAASVLAAQTFCLFLFSRFLLGLSRHDVLRLQRGPAIAIGIACLASLAGTVAAVAVEAGYPVVDRVAARVLAVVLGVLAVEMLLNFIWELYRPRRRRELNRAYESRLGGLVTDPGTWVKSVGGALDYQFGFKVSETWFYRFLEGALLPLVVFQLLALYLLSCLVFLGPEEEGIVERFGKPRAASGHLTSGLHLKWPWPFETVRRFPVKRLQTLTLGFHDDDDGRARDVLLWTVPHFRFEDQFLAANPEAAGTAEAGGAVPVNLVSFNVPIHYQITDINRYAYQCVNPQLALEQIGYRSLTLEAASRGLFDMLGEGRQPMADALRRRIQGEADRLGLGVRIVFVGLQGVHPPVAVAGAFQSVIGATEESGAAVLLARAAATRSLPLAAAEAERIRLAAEAAAVRRTEIAAAEADRYQQRLAADREAPAVFRSRLYLDTVRAGLRGARKYVVAAPPGRQVVILDLEEKLSPELFDFSPADKPPAPGADGAPPAAGAQP